MQAKLFAILSFIIIMLVQPLQAVQLSSSTVVGNILYEQTTVYILALLMLIALVAM